MELEPLVSMPLSAVAVPFFRLLCNCSSLMSMNPREFPGLKPNEQEYKDMQSLIFRQSERFNSVKEDNVSGRLAKEEVWSGVDGDGNDWESRS
jgi:hypothetical protein